MQQGREDEEAKKTDLFVHIGDSELRGNLPVEGSENLRLYNEVREKQSQLAKLKEVNEKIMEQKAETIRLLEAQTQERDFLKSLNEANAKQLENENHLIKLVEAEKGRVFKDLAEMQMKLHDKKERIRSLKNIYNNQKRLCENLRQSEEAQKEMRQDASTKLAAAEQSCADLKKALESDNKVANDLETYFKKLTRQIYEKQRELERMKLGEENEIVETELLKREIRQRDKEQKALQEKYAKTLASLEKSKAISNEKLKELNEFRKEKMGDEASRKEKENEIVVNEKKMAELKKEFSRANEEIRDIDEKREKLYNEWNLLQDQLSKLEVDLSEAAAKEKMERKKHKRYETKIEILKLEPPQTMYKAYGSSTDRSKNPVVSADETSRRVPLDSNLLRRKQKESEEASLNSARAESSVKELRKHLEDLRRLERSYQKRLNELEAKDESPASEDEEETSGYRSNSTASSINEKIARSRSLPKSNKASIEKSKEGSNGCSEKLAREGIQNVNKKRDKLLAERASEAEAELEIERNEIADRVAVLATKVGAMETAKKRLNSELKKLAEEEASLKEKVAAAEAGLKAKKKEAETKSKQMLEKRKMDRSAKEDELKRVIAERDKEEKKRNELKQEIKSNRIMINNYRNRFNTLSQMRKNLKGGKFEMNKLVANLEEWKKKVNESEKELESLKAILATANEKNAIVKNDLTTMKPYDVESAELARMYKEEKVLEEQLMEAKKKLKALQLEKHGEIVFEADS